MSTSAIVTGWPRSTSEVTPYRGSATPQGTIAEKFATTAADSLYAAYRMARLGLIVMELCRPVPFRDDEVPSISSLVGNALRGRRDRTP